MRGLAACFGDDADDIFFLDAGGHGGRQLLDNQNGACRCVADLDLLHAEQDAENAVADVADVSGALHGQIVSRCGEHINKHLANLVNRSFGTLICFDKVFDFAAHEGVADDRDVTLEDLSFLVTGGLTDRVCLLHGVITEFVNRLAVACQLRVDVGYFLWRVVQRLLGENHDSADADAVGYADTFQHVNHLFDFLYNGHQGSGSRLPDPYHMIAFNPFCLHASQAQAPVRYSPKPLSILSTASASASFSSGPSQTSSISLPHLMQAAMMFSRL